MEYTEEYRGVAITIITSQLASHRHSFVVYLDGRLMTADIDGLYMAETLDVALTKAKTHLDRQVDH